jgi:hypothetical protein
MDNEICHQCCEFMTVSGACIEWCWQALLRAVALFAAAGDEEQHWGLNFEAFPQEHFTSPFMVLLENSNFRRISVRSAEEITVLLEDPLRVY